MANDPELGTLIVVVLKARNLIDKHSFYKQDVFAQAVLSDTTKKTPVDVKGGQHPVWDSELRFPIMKAVSDKTRKIEISCFAKEPRSNDLLGKGTVDITETLKTGEFDDWVPLDIDGVARGDVYLEMTFFSSGPAPAPQPSAPSSLAVNRVQNLARRPSKLPPSERLYRPPQTTPSNLKPNVRNVPSSSAPPGRPYPAASHMPSKGRDSALPPLPEAQSGPIALPGSLKPGRGPKIQGNTPPSLPPPFLRPGNGNASGPAVGSSDRAHRSPSVSPPPPSNPRLPQQPPPSYGSPHYNTSSTPNPYLSAPTPAPSINPVIPSSGSAAEVPLVNYPPPYTTNPSIPPNTPAPAPPNWQTSIPPTNISFPMPMISPAPQPDVRQAEPYRNYGPHYQAVPQQQHSSTPDPYLTARYQTPLPLPPGVAPTLAASPPRDRQRIPTPDPARLEALKRAEEDAIRRREQEQRDLELALQLDKELNV